MPAIRLKWNTASNAPSQTTLQTKSAWAAMSTWWQNKFWNFLSVRWAGSCQWTNFKINCSVKIVEENWKFHNLLRGCLQWRSLTAIIYAQIASKLDYKIQIFAFSVTSIWQNRKLSSTMTFVKQELPSSNDKKIHPSIDVQSYKFKPCTTCTKSAKNSMMIINTS